MTSKNPRDLQRQLDRALRKERWADAFRLYAELGVAEPEEPRWPNRAGDLHRRLGQDAQAVSCYERAVDRYAKLGFVARAAAMAKVLLSIDPTRTDVLARVDPTKARELVALQRRAAGLAAERPRRTIAQAPALEREAANHGDAADEARFRSIAPQDAIELDLSDAEIIGRAAPPPPPTPAVDEDDGETIDVLFVDDDAPTAEELATLPASPLFASVPPAALAELVEQAGLVEAEPAEVFVALGSPADALYVITEGRAEVRVPGREGPPIVLGEGDVVGESCLLDDVTRRADVVAQTPLRALSLPKTTLDTLVEAHAEVGEVLTELLGRRLLSNLLATSELFAAFDPESKRALARLFEVRRAEEGTPLMKAGERSDGLYVLLAGSLMARRADGEDVKLSAGEVLGERSLLDHAPSDFDCRADSDVLLLRLPRSRFVELCASYPPVLASLAELAAREDVTRSAPVV